MCGAYVKGIGGLEFGFFSVIQEIEACRFEMFPLIMTVSIRGNIRRVGCRVSSIWRLLRKWACWGREHSAAYLEVQGTYNPS